MASLVSSSSSPTKGYFGGKVHLLAMWVVFFFAIFAIAIFLEEVELARTFLRRRLGAGNDDHHQGHQIEGGERGEGVVGLRDALRKQETTTTTTTTVAARRYYPSYRYCVVQITSERSGDRSASLFKTTRKNGSSHAHASKGGTIHGMEMFNALREAVENRCDGDWYFIGDDDTLFFPDAIEAWMHQRSPQKDWIAAHGNVYSPHEIPRSWYTGGSGVALTKKAVHSMLEKIKLPEYLNVAKQEFANCKCFDVPFMRVLQKLPGARTFHSPNTFLDSCQDCGDNRALLEVPIVACHAATLFRDRNPHAGSKASRGGDGYFEYSEIRTYLRPKRFEDASPEQRRTHFDDLCAHSSKQQQPFAPTR